MKFCKTYQEYMEGIMEKKLPGVGFKKLKKILKKCRQEDLQFHDTHLTPPTPNCPHQECPVCEGTFFPSLLKEMGDVVGCFNKRAQKLLDLHLATGFKKYLIWCKGKQVDHNSLIQEGQDLVTYAMINAVAVRKILKKYDKVHYCKQGQAFKSRAQSMHVEILQSPWLCELMALHINLREKNLKTQKTAKLFDGCYLKFTDGKPSLTCELFDSVKLDLDLTCSICLDTVFDPVALTCGHIFCHICACSAASVSIVDGLQATSAKEKCPLCREAGVYEGAVHLDELHILLSRRYSSPSLPIPALNKNETQIVFINPNFCGVAYDNLNFIFDLTICDTISDSNGINQGASGEIELKVEVVLCNFFGLDYYYTQFMCFHPSSQY